MNRLAFLIVALLTGLGWPLHGGEGREVVKRSLPFLEKEGVAWMEDRGCVSCHQVPSMLWSLNGAARAGFEVDHGKLAKWWEWSLDWKNWVDPKRKVEEPKAIADNVDTIAKLLLGRIAAEKDAVWVVKYRDDLVKLQDTNGAWKAQGQLPLGRRPARETQEVTTLYVLLALKSAASAESPRAEVFQRASAWLAKAQPGKSTEWWALQLLAHREFGRTEEAEASRRSLLAQQNSDGGWGWLVGEPGDAFGTGLALYALGRSGMTVADSAVQKATVFLKTSQAADGSWAVPSTRAKDNKKVRDTSSYWGTAWAALGILETLPGDGSHGGKDRR